MPCSMHSLQPLHSPAASGAPQGSRRSGLRAALWPASVARGRGAASRSPRLACAASGLVSQGVAAAEAALSQLRLGDIDAAALPAALGDATTTLTTELLERAAAALPEGTPLLSALSRQLLASTPVADTPLVVALLALAGFTAVATPVAMLAGRGSDALPSVYDPDVIAAYYARRPQQLLARQASLAALASAFAAGLLADRAAGCVPSLWVSLPVCSC